MPKPFWLENALLTVNPDCDWMVTWPTRPGGVYSIPVDRARDATDAATQARALNSPTAPGYTIAYDVEPSVWRIKRFGRSYHVSGPRYSD